MQQMDLDMEIKTNVIKRSGEEVSFDISKIVNAISKANREVDKIHQLNEYQILAVAESRLRIIPMPST